MASISKSLFIKFMFIYNHVIPTAQHYQFSKI